jgi:hypothetical protein
MFRLLASLARELAERVLWDSVSQLDAGLAKIRAGASESSSGIGDSTLLALLEGNDDFVPPFESAYESQPLA